MKFSFTTLFDKLKAGLYEEALCFFSSDSFNDASPREFCNEFLDLVDALDSIKSDFRIIFTKYSK